MTSPAPCVALLCSWERAGCNTSRLAKLLNEKQRKRENFFVILRCGVKCRNNRKWNYNNIKLDRVVEKKRKASEEPENERPAKRRSFQYKMHKISDARS